MSQAETQGEEYKEKEMIVFKTRTTWKAGCLETYTSGLESGSRGSPLAYHYNAAPLLGAMPIKLTRVRHRWLRRRMPRRLVASLAKIRRKEDSKNHSPADPISSIQSEPANRWQ